MSGRSAHAYLAASPRPRILPEIDRVGPSPHHDYVLLRMGSVLSFLTRACHKTPALPQQHAI